MKSIYIGESVNEIGENAFGCCWDLETAEFASIEKLCSIKFANSNANPLGMLAHLYIDGEEVTDIVIPETVTAIGNYAFFGCTQATSLIISNSVTEIGEYAFSDCYNLPAVNIPNSVKSINYFAFRSCLGLKSVTIPASVTFIGDFAFEGCNELTEVYCESEDPMSGGDSIFEASTYTDATLYVPAASVYKYKEVSPWKNFVNIKGVDITGIDEITADSDNIDGCEVYNSAGMRVSDSVNGLVPGIYFVRHGNSTEKIIVK